MPKRRERPKSEQFFHLLLGIRSYHRSMTHEWPPVSPLDDWDDD